MKRKKLFALTMVLSIVIIAIFGYLQNIISNEFEIYEKTLRLHIPANSDSKEDQELKIKVRDRVLELLKNPLSECKNKSDALKITEKLKSEIKNAADEVIVENGFDYKSKVSIIKEYYPRKVYENITLPAGKYCSLKIELGKSEGHNWFCVLFPQLCTSEASTTKVMAEVGFTPNQIRLLTEKDGSKYEIRFKILEILEKLFHK